VNVLPPASTSLRLAIQAINQLIAGRSNAAYEVTLTPGATTTTLTSENINANSRPVLTAKTANAAAALATTYAVTTSAGVVTITHANNAQTDRTFHVLIIGG